MRELRLPAPLTVTLFAFLATTGCLRMIDPCDQKAGPSVIEGGWKVVTVVDEAGPHFLPYKPAGLPSAPQLIEGSLILAATDYLARDETCDELSSTSGWVIADYRYDKGPDAITGLFDYGEGSVVTLKTGKYRRDGRVDEHDGHRFMSFSGNAGDFKKGWESLGVITVILVQQ